MHDSLKNTGAPGADPPWREDEFGGEEIVAVVRGGGMASLDEDDALAVGGAAQLGLGERSRREGGAGVGLSR